MIKTKELDTVFVALANGKRRIILHELAQRPATITHLASLTNLSLPAIHKHMAVLEGADLIVRRKAGRSNFVTLNHQSLSIAQEWISKYQTHWSSPKATLENYIQALSK